MAVMISSVLQPCLGEESLSLALLARLRKIKHALEKCLYSAVGVL